MAMTPPPRSSASRASPSMPPSANKHCGASARTSTPSSPPHCRRYRLRSPAPRWQDCEALCPRRQWSHLPESGICQSSDAMPTPAAMAGRRRHPRRSNSCRRRAASEQQRRRLFRQRLSIRPQGCWPTSRLSRAWRSPLQRSLRSAKRPKAGWQRPVHPAFPGPCRCCGPTPPPSGRRRQGPTGGSWKRRSQCNSQHLRPMPKQHGTMAAPPLQAQRPPRKPLPGASQTLVWPGLCWGSAIARRPLAACGAG
mmetsp:Transcript_38973/g.84819  ORF Transcript_38973/g.84819 Transcript_38973/m.84819 type:complete len:252 (+) Transcript_38973:1460-2215(+)